MGDIHYLRDIPAGDYILPDDVRAGECIVITARSLERIAEYAASVPTSPSAGRVYRRTHIDGVYVFVVRNAPADDPRGGQLHHPLRALVVEP